MKRTILLILISPFFTYPSNSDSLQFLKLNISYGTGNHIAGFVYGDIQLQHKADYSELLIEVERNIHKLAGIIFKFTALRNRDFGLSCCDCENPSYGSLNFYGYSGSAAFYLNWKYIGFKFGVLGVKRDQGWCKGHPDIEEIYPSLLLKLGLINKIYFTINGPEDFVLYPFSIGVCYHFPDFFSQIWLGKTVQDKEIELYELYLVKIQKLIFHNYVFSIQGYHNSPKNLKGIRIGLSYLIQ